MKLADITARQAGLAALASAQMFFGIGGYVAAATSAGKIPSMIGLASSEPAMLPEIYKMAFDNNLNWPSRTTMGVMGVTFTIGTPGYEIGRGLYYLQNSPTLDYN